MYGRTNEGMWVAGQSLVKKKARANRQHLVYLGRGLLLRVDHDGIGASLSEGDGTLEGLLLAVACDESLEPGHDHEFCEVGGGVVGWVVLGW